MNIIDMKALASRSRMAYDLPRIVAGSSRASGYDATMHRRGS